MKQPPTEPSPPMIRMMNTRMVMLSPIWLPTTAWYCPHIIPPMPASAVPAMNTPMKTRRM